MVDDTEVVRWKELACLDLEMGRLVEKMELKIRPWSTPDRLAVNALGPAGCQVAAAATG